MSYALHQNVQERARRCAAALLVAGVLGCGESDEEASPATGGTPSTGGTTSAGGTTSSGGTTATGGAPSTGGTSAAGGSAGTSSGGQAFRPFTSDSYWNKPLPANAPIDENSALYIADAQNPAESDSYLGFTGAPGANQSFAAPVYWPKVGDPVYTIAPTLYGPTAEVTVPLSAVPQSGSDGALWLFDLPKKQLIQLWQASFDGASWSASSVSRYMIESNGLDKSAAGSNEPLNTGHRGVPPNVQVVRLDEAKAGAIEHRLECYWHATGRPNDTTPWFYWPMTGYEQNKGGIVPEGIVIRIKPSVDLSQKGLSPVASIIALALQKYGCTIGDNSGGTNNRLKLERDEAAWKALDPALTGNALDVLSWTDWEFVKGGYDPP